MRSLGVSWSFSYLSFFAFLSCYCLGCVPTSLPVNIEAQA